MCYEFTLVFAACGHTEPPLTFTCASPANGCFQQSRFLVQEMVEPQHFPILCHHCLMNEYDPRNSPTFRRGDHYYHPGKDSFDYKDVLASFEAILTRTKVFGSGDQLAFIRMSAPPGREYVDGEVPNVPYMGRETMNRIEWTYMILYAALWWSYDNGQTVPAFEHRLLLLQLQLFIIYGRFTHFASRQRKVPRQDRMEYLKSILTIVPMDSLRWDQRKCNICTEEIGVRNSDGVLENPVKTSCKHGQHIFGELCLHQWLKENETCPNCRYCLLPFILPVRVEDHIGDEHDEAEASNEMIPDWIITLLGENPRENLMQIDS